MQNIRPVAGQIEKQPRIVVGLLIGFEKYGSETGSLQKKRQGRTERTWVVRLIRDIEAGDLTERTEDGWHWSVRFAEPPAPGPDKDND
ncbi:hypothetical protein ACFOSW_24290 [Paenibacillus sp. GCM10012303]